MGERRAPRVSRVSGRLPAGSAMFLLCTTRPELYEHHPQFGAKVRNAERIDLGPLSDEATSRLISALLKRETLPPDTQGALLEPTAGNPSYAQEFVRLLADRGLTSIRSASPVSRKVQGLIASRSTCSPSSERPCCRTYRWSARLWAGAILEMGVRDDSQVEVSLDDLSRRRARPHRKPVLDGRGSRVPIQARPRQGCPPRSDRARRPRERGISWLPRGSSGRPRDGPKTWRTRSPITTCMRSSSVVPPERDRDVEGLEASARRYLALAGERALALDVASAEASLARALELAPPGHQERPGLFERWAQAAIQQGRLQEARSALEASARRVSRGG